MIGLKFMFMLHLYNLPYISKNLDIHSGHTSFWGDAYGGREICIWKLGNVYQRKVTEKQMMHFKSTFTTRFIRWFSKKMFFTNDPRFPFTILACLLWSFALCVVWDMLWKSRFLHYAVCIASMVLHTATFLCIIYAATCVNATLYSTPILRTALIHWWDKYRGGRDW